MICAYTSSSHRGTVQLERLQENLTKLRLVKSREPLEALLQEASAADLSYADFLERLLGEEVSSKTQKNITMRTSLARFPFVKSLESFDFCQLRIAGHARNGDR